MRNLSTKFNRTTDDSRGHNEDLRLRERSGKQVAMFIIILSKLPSSCYVISVDACHGETEGVDGGFQYKLAKSEAMFAHIPSPSRLCFFFLPGQLATRVRAHYRHLKLIFLLSCSCSLLGREVPIWTRDVFRTDAENSTMPHRRQIGR